MTFYKRSHCTMLELKLCSSRSLFIFFKRTKRQIIYYFKMHVYMLKLKFETCKEYLLLFTTKKISNPILLYKFFLQNSNMELRLGIECVFDSTSNCYRIY